MNVQPRSEPSDNPLLEAIRLAQLESREKALEHEQLRESEPYQAKLSFLRQTIHDLIESLRFSEITASRWNDFTDNYLLPRHFDDICEAALTAQLAIENGALNPARRELRYMLEVAVNIAYVDEIRSKDSREDRIAYYRGKKTKKANVDHVKELPLRMLGAHRETFQSHVIQCWVRSSNYVHLTKRQMDRKLELRKEGVRLGLESVEMLDSVVQEVHEACSIVMILALETIGPSFTGDMIVGLLDENDKWAFHASEYVAVLDEHFDYKHERQDKLAVHKSRRLERILYCIGESRA